jgi:hypothetical protein
LASWHIQAGTPLHVLQELGGWESVQWFGDTLIWHQITHWENEKKLVLRLDFDHTLKVEYHGSKVTTDADLLLYREWSLIRELVAV